MALVDLVDKVREYFADGYNLVPIDVYLGEREPTKNRVMTNVDYNQVEAGQPNNTPYRLGVVVFDPIGGSYGPARSPGRNPRPLRTWLHTIDVHCFSYDGYHANQGATSQNEEAQYLAVEMVHNWIIQAIYKVAHGTFQLSAPRWVKTPVEKKKGKELIFTLTLETPIMDIPLPTIVSTPENPITLDQTNYVVTGNVYADDGTVTETVGCNCS